MKKSILKLLALCLSATTMSGCSLSDIFGGSSLPEETREFTLSLRDYSSTVIQNTAYNYDGKVYVVYKDDKSEKEVTSLCTYSAVDTSKLGKVILTVKYETKKFIRSTTAQLIVIEAPVLDSISFTNYSSTALLGSTYTFDGKVMAHYTGGQVDKDVTASAVIDSSQINTNVAGDYQLKASYKEGSITKEASATIRVYAEMPKISKIEASGYTTSVDKGKTYVFDGKVTATYVGGGTADVTRDCTFSTLDTSRGGEQTLTISIVDTANNNRTVSTTVKITVISHLESISGSTVSVGVGKTSPISLTYAPDDATNKKISSYESSNTSVATVDASGNVRGVAVGTTSITVTAEEKSADNTSITCTISVEVTDTPRDAWTILVYMCGSDLESGGGYDIDEYGGQATADLEEIASVSGQPDDVNIVVQAGGASKWLSKYSGVISKDKRNRFHLENKKYVKDDQSAKVNMAAESSFQDFLEWGIKEYPADKIGIILWNHGGAMDGCCVDEQYSSNYGYDYLTPSECDEALTKARNNLEITEKFEFIGYDCCLMQVQDIAGLNSKHAKYQVASQEAEYGYGWDYDQWVDNLFAKQSTENILKEIVDTFKTATTSYYNQYHETNDQTLSYLDLSKWDAYETAFESFASSLSSVVNTSSKWDTFKSFVNNGQKFGHYVDEDEHIDDYPYDVFDARHFFTRMKSNSTYSSLSSEVQDCIDAYDELVKYEWHATAGSPNASGLSLFCPTSGWNSDSIYPTTATPLSTWRSFCIKYGEWYSGYSY